MKVMNYITEAAEGLIAPPELKHLLDKFNYDPAAGEWCFDSHCFEMLRETMIWGHRICGWLHFNTLRGQTTSRITSAIRQCVDRANEGATTRILVGRTGGHCPPIDALSVKAVCTG